MESAQKQRTNGSIGIVYFRLQSGNRPAKADQFRFCGNPAASRWPQIIGYNRNGGDRPKLVKRLCQHRSHGHVGHRIKHRSVDHAENVAVVLGGIQGRKNAAVGGVLTLDAHFFGNRIGCPFAAFDRLHNVVHVSLTLWLPAGEIRCPLLHKCLYPFGMVVALQTLYLGENLVIEFLFHAAFQ